jgi:hypothetical protein
MTLLLSLKYNPLDVKLRINPCGGAVEYIHRDPASRRRRERGSLKSETVKFGHESHGTRTRK